MHKRREYESALKFDWSERLTKDGLSQEEVGKAVFSRIGTKPPPSEGGRMAMSSIAATGKRTNYAGIDTHFSGSAPAFAGLSNVHGPQATYRHLHANLSLLAAAGLASIGKGKPYAHLRGTGQSRFKCDDAICDALSGFGQEYVKQPFVQMREASGSFTAPNSGATYDKTVQEVHRINDMIATLNINMISCGQERGEVLRTSKVAIPCKPLYVHREFEENSYDLGGTIKTHSYGKLDQIERKRIKIDNTQVAEISIKHSLAAQCYHKIEKQMVEHPYQIDGYDDELTSAAFEVCLNALDLREAVKSVQRLSYLDETDATLFVVELMSKHSDLKDLFFSGVGPELRSKESEMMIQVILALIDDDVGCLPLRSGVIVPESHQKRAEDIFLKSMREVSPLSHMDIVSV